MLSSGHGLGTMFIIWEIRFADWGLINAQSLLGFDSMISIMDLELVDRSQITRSSGINHWIRWESKDWQLDDYLQMTFSADFQASWRVIKTESIKNWKDHSVSLLHCRCWFEDLMILWVCPLKYEGSFWDFT